MKKNVLFLAMFIGFVCLAFVGCSGKENCIDIEVRGQSENLLDYLTYKIVTKNDEIFVKFDLAVEQEKEVFLNEKIMGMEYNFSTSNYANFPDDANIVHTFFYNKKDKKVVVYYYRENLHIEQIDTLDEFLYVRPFESPDIIYTAYFIYNGCKCQVISLTNEIAIEKYVDRFDYELLRKTGVSQYKLLGVYNADEENIVVTNEHETYSSITIENYVPYNNYIFPEENNRAYKEYYESIYAPKPKKPIKW